MLSLCICREPWLSYGYTQGRGWRRIFTHQCFWEACLQRAGEDMQLDEAEPSHTQ